MFSGCPGNFEVITGDGPLPMAIFELLEYIVNEVTSNTSWPSGEKLCPDAVSCLAAYS